MEKTLSEKKRNAIIYTGLVLLVMVVYWQVRSHDFVSFDDGVYISNNPYVGKGLTWETIWWAFSTTYANFWHPLTWLSHLLDWELYGANPAGHHFSNLILHTLNSLLLFSFLLRTTHAPWKSALVALLFAIHPLHVESVAWASERKDVLSTLFWILTMGAYVSYTQKPNLRSYGLVLSYFILGLMAKPMLVTLPFVLLLWDYWPLGRIRFHPKEITEIDTNMVQKNNPPFRLGKLVLEKLPLFFLAAAASVVAFFAQSSGGATKSLDLFPWNARMSNALVSYVTYIAKTIWPKDLAVFYPHPGSSTALHDVFLATLFLLAITLWALKKLKTSPFFLVGWLWFLGTLVPVLGIVQVGDHGMADRYTYVPLIGLFIVISWGIPRILKPIPHREIVLTVSASAFITALVCTAWFQVGHWKNSVALFKKALAVGPPSPLAHTDMGEALAVKEDLEGAIWHFQEAIRINPGYLSARVNLGSVLAKQGRFDEAMGHYKEAIRVDPTFAGAYYNMANALLRQGRLDLAISNYRQALLHQPEDPDIHNNLGIALAQNNEPEKAQYHFQKALHISPHFVSAKQNLRLVLQDTATHTVAVD